MNPPTCQPAVPVAQPMGVQCPTCSVPITTENAGGYRTFCEKCATQVDIADSPEYQKFVESMAHHCRCSLNSPCDGVLAGGFCDNIRDDDDDEETGPDICPECRGSGQYDDCTPCPYCDGDGTEPW